MNDFNTNGLTFTTQSDIVVIGTNPEMADYDNPRGDIHSYAAYVVAANDHGDTRVFHVGTEAHIHEMKVQAQAVRMAAALNARFAAGKLPVGFDRWSEGRPVYGSPAYQAYGQADDLAWERDMDERF